MNRNKTNRLQMISAGLLLAAHCVYLVLVMMQVPLNSDHANQILQGQDILSGNPLLKGWNLTGVSFYFSELLFYTLGTALFGVDTNAYIFAAVSMVITLSLLAYFLAFREKESSGAAKALLFLALCGLPSLEWMGYLRGHCAIFVYYFCALHCLGRAFSADEAHPRVWLGLYLFLLIPGCMSDMTLFIIGVIPAMLFSAWNLLQNGCRLSRKVSGIVFLGSPAAAGVGMVCDSLLMRLGHINKNGFLDTRKFLDIFKSGDKAALLFKGILTNARGMLPAETLRQKLCLAVALAVTLWTVCILVRALRRYLLNRDFDTVSVLIGLGLALMTAVCFFTDIYTSEDSARYIAFYPFAAAVLICRGAEEDGWFRKAGLTAALSAAVILLFLIPVGLHRVETPQDRLAAFLEENGLTTGYAAFWNASHTTVASNDRVHVRAVRVRAKEVGKPDSLNMQNWFCKDEWYFPDYANFVAFDGKGYLDVREDYVEELIGTPDRILENGEYRVFVYDRDITPQITLELAER